MVYLRQTQTLQLNFTDKDPIDYSIKCEFIPDYVVVKQIIFIEDDEKGNEANWATDWDLFTIQTDLIDTKCGQIANFKRNENSYPNIYYPVSNPINGSYWFKLVCSKDAYSGIGKVNLTLEFNKWVEHSKYKR